MAKTMSGSGSVAKPAATVAKKRIPVADGKTSPMEPGRAPRVGDRSLRVRAKDLLYYNHMRRREGDVFSLLVSTDFNPEYMEFVDGRTPEKVTGAQEALDRQSTVERNRKQGGGPQVVDAIGADDDE